MKNKTKLITAGAVGGGVVLLGMMWRFVRPERKILEKLKIRVDAKGNGNYGSSRTPPYNEHKGIDLIVSPGDKVYAPFAGTAVFLNTVYPNSKATYQGIKIFTDDGKLEVDILYIIPTVKTNDIVKKGQLIGYAQDISIAHSSGMLPHIHVEHKDRATNKFIDPTNYYFQNKATQTASMGESENENPSFT